MYTGRVALRPILIAYIAWIAAIGALCRRVLSVPSALSGRPLCIVEVLVLFVFPVFAILAVWFAQLAVWQVPSLLAVELMLFVLYCVALLPAVR